MRHFPKMLLLPQGDPFRPSKARRSADLTGPRLLQLSATIWPVRSHCLLEKQERLRTISTKDSSPLMCGRGRWVSVRPGWGTDDESRSRPMVMNRPKWNCKGGLVVVVFQRSLVNIWRYIQDHKTMTIVTILLIIDQKQTILSTKWTIKWCVWSLYCVVC